MSEMVERVARAIAMHWGCAPQTYDLNPDVQKDWAGYARAAIEAMREPTQAMIGAPNLLSGRLDIWHAMIDAALRSPSILSEKEGAASSGSVSVRGHTSATEDGTKS